MEFVGSMNDFPENLRGMDQYSYSDGRGRRILIRDFCRSLGQSHRDNCPWRISWIARRTWIPAINKATGRKRNNGKKPRKIKKHHIVNILTAVYLTIVASAGIATVVLWVK